MTRLLAAPTRYFRTVLVFAVVFTAPAMAQHTSQSPLTDEDMEIIRKSKDITESAQTVGVPDWLRTDNAKFSAAHQEAKALVQQLQRSDPTMKRMNELARAKTRSPKVVVFASRSLGSQGLKDVLDMASGNPDVLVAFRGIPEKANLGEAMLEIQQMAAERDPVPNIVINPDLFTEYNVTSVPTIIVRKEQSLLSGKLPEEVARVTGLSNPAWLLRRVYAGADGDFGVRGPVESISEPDLIEVMKKRFAKIDWEEQKRGAIKNFWNRQNFRELPEAVKDRVRELDPTVYISENITAPNGALIAKKGDLINPLNVAPFTQAVIVFDPLDDDQIERVKDALPRINKVPGVTRITYIVTRLDREKGWDSYTKTTDTFNAPVFLLTPDVAQRFDLEYVPSIITAQGKRFVVQELADTKEKGGD